MRRSHALLRKRARRLLFESLEDRRVMTVPYLTLGFGPETYESGSPYLAVILWDPNPSAVSVDWTLTGPSTGSDWVVASGTLTFPANPSNYATAQNPTVMTIDDDVPEFDKVYTLTLSNPVNATISGSTSGNTTLIDNDSASAMPPDYTQVCGTCGVPGDMLSQANVPGGVLNTFASPGYSDHPVRYANGAVYVSSEDIQSDGFGMHWGITRQWTNAAGYARQNLVGNGMVIGQQPRLVQANGTSTLAIITDSQNSRYFDQTMYGYEPRGFSQESLVYDSGADEYVLTTPAGVELRFFGFSTLLPGVKRGSFKSYKDSFGNTTAAVSHTGYGDIQEVQRSYTAGGTTTIESFFYEYVSSGENQGLIESVKLQRKVGAGAFVTERDVEYTYYGSSDTYGNWGDLELAVIKDGANNVIDTTYYRYYKPSESNGFTHGLKYVVYPQSYARLVEAEGSTLDSISNTNLATYADHYFEYDGSRRATKEIAQGAGCSTCSGGQGEFTYSYTTSYNSDGYNSWKRKTVETLPDGNQNIVYTNYRGQVMLQAYKDTTTNEQWISYFRFDGDGRVVLAAQPSAMSGYNDSYADLVVESSGNFTYVRDSQGLVTVYDYYTSTTATTSVAGGVDGYLETVSIREGETDTDIPQSTSTYIAATAGGSTIYLPVTNTVYTNTNGTGDLDTSFEYTFYSGKLQVESKETTNPAGDVTTEFFDAYGRVIWTKDASGYLHYTAYDDKTGAVVKTIRDVDTTQTGDFANKPSGWTTPTGGGIHAISTYEVDGLGRTTKETDPDGRITYTFYDDDSQEMRIYAGWNATTNLPTGPTIVVREDRDSSYSEVITMSATPTVSSGRPTGAESISNLESLTRTFYSDAGQKLHTDEYFLLAGLTYTVATSLGTQGTNFYRTEYAYDSRGRHSKTVKADGTILRTVFDGQGRPVSEWIGDDDTPVSGYWSPSNPAGMELVREYEYDSDGVGDSQVTMLTDALGRETVIGYDFRGRVLTTTLPDPDSAGSLTSPVTSFTYDNLGRKLTSTDPLTNVTSYLYEDAYRRVTVTLPDPDGGGSLTSPQLVTVYDALGNVATETAASGAVTTYVYNGLGLVKSVTQPDPDDAGPLTSPVTSYQYDNSGNLRYQTDPLSNVTEFQYDRLSRMVKQIDADPDEIGSLTAPETDYAYDSAGHLLSITDPLDKVTSYNYNDLGWLLEEELPDPDGAGSLNAPTTVYTYDEVGRRTSLTDPVGNMTSWTYDVHGWVLTETNELSAARSFDYDAVGNLIERTDRLGRVIEYTYDNLNRLTTEEWLDSLGSPIRTFSYDYDAMGRLLEASDPAATYTYDYDNLGRLIEEVQDIDGFTPTITFGSGYDVNSRRESLSATVGSTADFLNEYLYDKLNRLTRLTQDSNGGNAVAEKRVDFGYEADGRFDSIVRYADLAGTLEIATSDYSYDNLRRLTGLLHHKGVTDFAGYDYTYDVASRITEIDSLIDGVTAYSHDFTGQLTGADHTSQTDESYSYDENGNRTMSGYDVDPNNLLMSDGTYNYEYDAEGNRTARVRITDGYRTEYTWDYRNRLVAVTEEDNANSVLSTVEHSYDYLNQWVRRIYDADGPVGGGLAVNTFMVHEDGQVVLQFVGVNGSDVQNRFLWGPSVDQILADEQVTSTSSAGNVIWPLTDHLNTTRDLVDRDESTGTVSVTNHREFDSFGNVVSETNSAVDHIFGFTGRYLDETTGLQNNLNRWYDAVNGQWVSEDPIGFEGGDAQIRRYAANSPLDSLDPSGLSIMPYKYTYCPSVMFPPMSTDGDDLYLQKKYDEFSGILKDIHFEKMLDYAKKYDAWEKLENAYQKLISNTMDQIKRLILNGTIEGDANDERRLRFLAIREIARKTGKIPTAGPPPEPPPELVIPTFREWLILFKFWKKIQPEPGIPDASTCL